MFSFNPKKSFSQQNQRGVSLFELGVVLSVSSIMLTLAVPSFNEMRSRQQLRATRSDLMGSLQLARINSISTGKHVVLCPSDDGLSCANSRQWEQGWIVFFDLDKDRERTPDEELLWRGTVDGQQQRVSTTQGRTRIRFSPLGTAPGTNLSITLCHTGLPQTSIKLVVSNSGRARIVEDAGAAQCGLG